MSNHPTKEQVWQMSSNHSDFVKQIPEGSPHREAVRPFVEASVDVLEDMFETPASLRSIADAKLRFLRYCVDNGFCKMMANMLSATVGPVNESAVTGLFTEVIGMLEPIVADVAGFLKEMSVTEEMVMTSSEVGLNAENQEAWKNGNLTIGDIMATQPDIIIQNPS